METNIRKQLQNIENKNEKNIEEQKLSHDEVSVKHENVGGKFQKHIDSFAIANQKQKTKNVNYQNFTIDPLMNNQKSVEIGINVKKKKKKPPKKIEPILGQEANGRPKNDGTIISLKEK